MLSLTQNGIELSAVERGKLHGSLTYTIQDVTFGDCLIKGGKNSGVELTLQAFQTGTFVLEHRSFRIEDGRVTPGR